MSYPFNKAIILVKLRVDFSTLIKKLEKVTYRPFFTKKSEYPKNTTSQFEI